MEGFTLSLLAVSCTDLQLNVLAFMPYKKPLISWPLGSWVSFENQVIMKVDFWNAFNSSLGQDDVCCRGVCSQATFNSIHWDKMMCAVEEFVPKLPSTVFTRMR